MKQTIDQSQFVQAFTDCGRGNQFSREALEAIFEWLEVCDPNTELDPIGVCCEFTEYESAIDAAFDYGQDFDREQSDNALEWLMERTVVLDALKSIVVANF